MPLARIIAHPSEDVSPLATRLYAMGYDVEVLAPGDKAEGAADVELALDTCALEEAMARADAFARANPDSEISIASGVLPALPARRGALSQVMGGISERVRSWRVRPQEPEQARAELPSAPAEHLARDRDAAQRLREREAEAARETELERLRKWEEAERERTAREAEIARRNQEAEAEVLRMAQQAQPWDEVGEKEPMPWSDAAAVPVDAAVAPELPSAVIQEKVAEPPAPVIMPAPPIPVAPVAMRTAPGARRARGRQRLREWRAAAVAATVVAAVLMLAWAAVSSPRPASPLTNGALIQTNSMEQQVPFGPVTVNATRPARTAVAPKPASQAKPAPQAAKPAARAKPVAAVRRPAKRVQKPSRAQRSEEPEVVVRRFSTAGPRNTHQQANANVKRVSDLD